MTRKLVIESSEEPTKIIEYSLLPTREIDSRIRGYEKKYGMPFSSYSSQYSCDNASPDEITDYMDWENLVAERAERRATSTEVYKRD